MTLEASSCCFYCLIGPDANRLVEGTEWRVCPSWCCLLSRALFTQDVCGHAAFFRPRRPPAKSRRPHCDLAAHLGLPSSKHAAPVSPDGSGLLSPACKTMRSNLSSRSAGVREEEEEEEEKMCVNSGPSAERLLVSQQEVLSQAPSNEELMTC